MKNTLIFIVVLALLVAVIVYWKPASKADTKTSTDVTESIDQDLSKVDVEGGMEADFQEVDKDVSTL